MPLLRTLFILLAYAGGLGWIAYELQRSPVDPGAPLDAGTTAPFTIASPPTFAAAIESYGVIIERPLFNEGRRPPSVPDEPPQTATARPAADPTDDIAGVRVSAIFKSDETRTALLELSNGSSRSVHTGERIGSWQVVEILDDHLVLDNRSERKVLRVHDFSIVRDPRPSSEPTQARRNGRSVPGARTLRAPIPRPRPQQPGRLPGAIQSPVPAPGRLD